jgi:hypothetical protein
MILAMPSENPGKLAKEEAGARKLSPELGAFRLERK